jgi:hypothetical protein
LPQIKIYIAGGFITRLDENVHENYCHKHHTRSSPKHPFSATSFFSLPSQDPRGEGQHFETQEEEYKLSFLSFSKSRKDWKTEQRETERVPLMSTL